MEELFKNLPNTLTGKLSKESDSFPSYCFITLVFCLFVCFNLSVDGVACHTLFGGCWCHFVCDPTDASGSSQQGAFQQCPVSAAWTGSATGVAPSSHALLLRVGVVPHPTYARTHKHTHAHMQSTNLATGGQHAAALWNQWLLKCMDSLNKQCYLPLIILLFCNCTLWPASH